MLCAKAVPYAYSILLLIAVSPSADGSSFEELGSFSGGKLYSDGRGVSADGAAAAGIGKPTSATEGFYWTSGGIVGVGRLPGGTISQAKGISGNGSVVVGYGDVPGSPFPPYKGFAWRADKGIIPLPDYNAVQVQSIANGANSDGSIVVGQANGPGGNRAAYWTIDWSAHVPTVNITSLDDMTVVKPSSLANAVTPDGSVIVGSGFAALGQEAFRWTAATGMVPLGDLDGGKYESSALAVSADGNVVVGYANIVGGSVPMRWTAATGLQPLGLDSTALGGLAMGISGDGRFIVGKTTALGAFIWDEAHGIRSLKSVLANDYRLGADVNNWTLDTAYAISRDGTTLIGTGHDPNGNTQAWRAVIPEPSLALMMILFAPLVLVRRRICTSPQRL